MSNRILESGLTEVRWVEVVVVAETTSSHQASELDDQRSHI